MNVARPHEITTKPEPGKRYVRLSPSQAKTLEALDEADRALFLRGVPLPVVKAISLSGKLKAMSAEDSQAWIDAHTHEVERIVRAIDKRTKRAKQRENELAHG